jgi:tetratricopeptide (TPR) repeat protein
MNARRTLVLALAVLTSASALAAPRKAVETYPPEYQAVLIEMVKAFSARDFPMTIDAIDRLEKLSPPNAHTINTRAAVMIEQGNFEEGRRLCQEALKLDPKYYAARFNLGEIPMMEKKYPEARTIFQVLLTENPRDELVQFRIFLTYLLEKNDAAAREILGRLKFPSDTPAFYYANGAWEFSRGNEKEGKAWVERGNWVFSPEKSQNYAESLIQLGWLERPAPPPKKAVASTNELPEPGAARAEDLPKASIELKVTTEAPGLAAPTKLDDAKPSPK